MLHRLLMLPLLLVAEISVAQSTRMTTGIIDSLDNEEAVLAFVQKHNLVYGQLSFHPSKVKTGLLNYEKKAQNFGALPYQKADFDNNGSTDLLINGFEEQPEYTGPISMVIRSFDRDSFQLVRLPEETFVDFFAAKAVFINSRACLHILQITHKSREEWYAGAKRATTVKYMDRRSDTLCWFQNSFIEKVPPVRHQIEKIRYLLCGGMTLTGAARLTIWGDSVKLEKVVAVSPEKMTDYGGIFFTRLDTATSQQLYALLERVDFASLKNSYEARGTDAATGLLEITYDGKKKKTIRDYGAMGTYGLAALQSLLLALPKTQNWVKTDIEPPMLLLDLDHK